METIKVKNRLRTFKGKLKDFNDLPIDKQKIFINIKEKINEILGKKVEIYIYGSYHHGYWDDESDYDILIISEEKPGLQDKLREITNLKVDVMFSPTELELILIP